MAITLTTLASFDDADGEEPVGGLVMDSNGNLFGSTELGGGSGSGTVFEIPATSGQITDLHSFGAGADGNYPYASLSTDASGNIYGTTFEGGSGHNGSVYALTPFRGSYAYSQIANIYTSGTDGYYPVAGVYVAPDGTITGTTYDGGTNGSGTVFTIAPNSSTPAFTSLPPANALSSSYYGPYSISAPTKVGAALYSTSYGDGTSTNPGTIFSFDPATSTITTVATFNASTGYGPISGVVSDSAGDLYGTTSVGGANGTGSIYEYNAATGDLTSLASFDAMNGNTTGYSSLGNLLRDGAGDLFGTAYSGGANGYGTVFELKAGASTIDVLYSFTGTGAGGSSPGGELIADQAGNLYGSTESGGTDSDGTVYEIQGADFVPICFATGTRIRAWHLGAVVDLAVEDLAVGDLLIAASGAARPIRWIGHRTITCSLHPRPADAYPVRISAHGFGPGLPSRDLHLSPGHPVLVGADEDGEGGHLVPIMCLINGTTIERVAVDEVTYWHVELDEHDILLAEGLPAESYIDLGSRPWFAGADGALYDPDMALPGMPGRCRPVAVDGTVVDAERRRLDMVFAARLTAACAWPAAEDRYAFD